jgi:hypothetical protein
MLTWMILGLTQADHADVDDSGPCDWAWRGREADVEAATEGLRRERDKLGAALETVRADLDERTTLLQDFENKFTGEYERWVGRCSLTVSKPESTLKACLVSAIRVLA